MYEYFPGRYAWNAAATLALACGGSLADIDEACSPLLERAEADDDGEEAWPEYAQAWSCVAQRAQAMAEDDAAQGRRASAALRYRRAALYHLLADRVGPPDPQGRAWRAGQACFERMRPAPRRVALPLPALLQPQAEPVIAIVLDGFAGPKEMSWLTGLPQALSTLGIGSLVLDAPGQGESLYRHGQVETPEVERLVDTALDWCATQHPHARVGLVATGMGGYYAVRAAALCERLAFAVGCGAMFDWGEHLRRELATPGRVHAAPYRFQRLKQRLGQGSVDACLAMASQMNLHAYTGRVGCPLLLLHGEQDVEVPAAEARRTLQSLAPAVRCELQLRSAAQGGAAHGGIDDLSAVGCAIGDWITRTLGLSSGGDLQPSVALSATSSAAPSAATA